MCLAIPMKLLRVDGNTGVVEIGGVERTADLSLVQPAHPGQYVVVHAGFAISITDEDEAMKTLELYDEMIRAAGKTSP